MQHRNMNFKGLQGFTETSQPRLPAAVMESLGIAAPQPPVNDVHGVAKAVPGVLASVAAGDAAVPLLRPDDLRGVAQVELPLVEPSTVLDANAPVERDEDLNLGGDPTGGHTGLAGWECHPMIVPHPRKCVPPGWRAGAQILELHKSVRQRRRWLPADGGLSFPRFLGGFRSWSTWTRSKEEARRWQHHASTHRS